MPLRFVFLLLGLGSSLSLLAQDATKDFQTKEISVFKNGTAFFIKSGQIATPEGSYRMLENIPAARFGTLWFHSPNDELRQVRSFTDEIEKIAKHKAANFSEMLSINLGKKVKLYMHHDLVVEGMVESVEETPQVVPPGNVRIVNQPAKVFTIRTESRWLVIQPGNIRHLEFMEKPNLLKESRTKTTQPVVQLDFAGQRQKRQLDMMYLANGINWTPNYLIELVDERKAKLSLRAEVANNLEDITNTDLNFVVGVPNFRFTEKLSSLVDLFGGIKNIPAQDRVMLSNALVSQTVGYAVDGVAPTPAFPSPEAEGSEQEDLFFYTIKNFSLPKGGRGYFDILEADIPIQHIYEASINGNNSNQRYFQQEFLFTPKDQNPVFHSIRVDNKGKTPWTTGSAMVVKKGERSKPISQDMLTYTAAGGHSFIKLTEAPDVRVKHAEKEIARKDRIIKNPQSKGYYLDLVTVEGQIKIRNYKSKSIDLNLRRTITGLLQDSSTKWLKAERVQRSGQNRITDVCWETTIGAGESLEISYTYQVYVPD